MRIPLAGATILALAGCGERPADPRGVGRDEVLLQVVATGRADTRPNEARFTAGVQSIAATSGEAGAANAEKMNRVVAALRGLGVADDDMRTQAITMQRIEHGAERGRFQAHNVVEVRLRDVTRAGPAIGAVTEAGANIMSGPNLAVADPEAASRSAYAAAYRAARARADAYAEAAGLEVARILVIRDAGDQGGGRSYHGDLMSPAAPRPVSAEVSAPPVQAGSGTNQVSVRVDFALTPK
jgi:hypothetical protein